MNKIGSIPLSKEEEIVFFIDEFKCKKWANIRKFIKSDRFTGFTPQGISLTKEHALFVLNTLTNLKPNHNNENEMEHGSFPIDDKKVLKINIGFFKGHFYIKIRIYYHTPEFNGPSKMGITINLEHLDTIKKYLTQMILALDEPLKVEQSEKNSDFPTKNNNGRQSSDKEDEFSHFF